MKKLSRVLSIGLMALAIAGLQLNLQAQETEGSSAKEKAAKADRALPFHGTLKAVDKDAGTVTVGGRTFKLTPGTQFLQGTLEDAKIGEKVGGSYRKASDGTLTVNSIRFGEKPEKQKQAKSTDE
jgi:hypothetical protein